jgi:hypothetical protein
VAAGHRTLVAILGMHRSGTSAVAGMLAEQGIEFGPVRQRNRFNPRGNRELPRLNELHEAVLERSGGSWWSPPDSAGVEAGDIRRRDEILATVEGETVGVKDPRMLVCPELWRDLELKRIGVIRNPVSVRRSLARRAAERPHRHPQLSAQQWEELWVTYNRALLTEHQRAPFPVVDFDRHDDLDRQVAVALRFWDLKPAGEAAFFDRNLIQHRGDGWRSEVESPAALELWDVLSGIAGT